MVLSQSDRLCIIDTALKEFNISDCVNNNYPTLKELEVLVKNSSYFVQRDIPTHFKDLLIKLSDENKIQITDRGNKKFLQDNGIIEKPKSKTKSTIQHNTKRVGSFSIQTDYAKAAATAITKKEYDVAAKYFALGQSYCEKLYSSNEDTNIKLSLEIQK